MLRKLAAAAVLVMGVVSVSQAFQAPGPSAPNQGPGARPGAGMRRGRGNAGVITAISGTTYTVKTMRGTEVKATIATGTPVVKANRTTGAIADLKVGVYVSIQGQRGTDGTVTATNVTISNPMVFGAIQTITDKQISVKGLDNKTTTYTITDKTAFNKGIQAAKLADFKAGDQVILEYNGTSVLSVRSFQAGGTRNGARNGRPFGGARGNANGNAPTPAPQPAAPADPAAGQ